VKAKTRREIEVFAGVVHFVEEPQPAVGVHHSMLPVIDEVG
jgi:hypothetical protein